jgi:1-deoxypentalenic acid 11beta-hydroxylase
VFDAVLADVCEAVSARLTGWEHWVMLTSPPIERLAVVNDLVDDPVGLQAWFDDHGYLYFRSVVAVDAVHAVRAELVAELQRQGAAVAGEALPVWTGRAVEEIDDNELYARSSYQDLFESPAMLELLLRAVFQEPVVVSRNTKIRYALPHDDRHLTPPHQDAFFPGATDDFRTIWIPLMPIDRTIGGFAIAEGSHHRGLRVHTELEGSESPVFRMRSLVGVPLDSIEERWLTADYEPGDVVIFHRQTLHRALPNESKLIRLSVDGRAQPARTPLSWQFRHTIVEGREFRADAQDLAVQAGVDTTDFEIVIAEMMKRGVPARPSAFENLILTLREEGLLARTAVSPLTDVRTEMSTLKEDNIDS